MSSSFSWFCWQMRRDRSLLILYTAVLICLFPLLSLALQDLGNTPFMFIELVFVPMACMFILSFCLPAHLFSHLWNKRELDMYSSIPLKRSAMFCIRYAAGLCWLLVPITVIIALECLVLFLMHMPPYDMLHMLQSTAELMVLSVLVYSLNVWIAIHCRNRSDALVMSIAYLLVPLIVVLGLYTIISSSIYDVSVGYSSSMQMSLLTDNELVRWLVNLICAPISYGMICAEGFGSAIGSLEGVICLPQYIWIVWLMESVLLIVWSHRAYITMPGEESGQRYDVRPDVSAHDASADARSVSVCGRYGRCRLREDAVRRRCLLLPAAQLHRAAPGADPAAAADRAAIAGHLRVPASGLIRSDLWLRPDPRACPGRCRALPAHHHHGSV